MTRLSKYGGADGATLTVTLSENIQINDRDYGGYSTFEIANVKNVFRRIETITTTEAEVYSSGITISGGTWVPANVKYLRFTNIDDTNHILLTFKNAANDEFAFKLDAGRTFIFNGDNSGGLGSIFDANGGAISSLSLSNLSTVTADADSGPCDLEIYIASTG